MMTVQQISIPEQRTVDGVAFPRVLAPSVAGSSLEDALCWLEEHGDALRAQLLECGAILLRGFPLAGAQDFDAVVQAAGFLGMPYIGGAAPRSDVHEGRVLTTNESPPS